MPKLPDPHAVTRYVPRNTRSVPDVGVATAGYARAADAYARGLSGQSPLVDIGRGLASGAEVGRQAQLALLEEEKKRQEAADKLALAVADGKRTEYLIKKAASFEEDPDWQTYEYRFDTEVPKELDRLAETLRPELREQWTAEGLAEVARARVGVQKLAFAGQKDNIRAHLDYLAESLPGMDDPAAYRAASGTEQRGLGSMFLQNIDRFDQALQGALTLNAITDREAVAYRRTYAINKATNVITGWALEDPDINEMLSKFTQMVHDEIEDPSARAAWEMLSQADQSKLSKSLMEEVSKLMSLRNSLREEADDQARKAAQEMLKDFMFGPTEELYERIMRNPHVTLNEMESIDRYYREGPQRDAEEDLTMTEIAIRQGDIRSTEQLFEFVLDQGARVSLSTLRGRLVPMVEDYQDERFSSAIALGRAHFRIPSDGGYLSELFADDIDKFASFEEQMRLWWENNRDGDPMAQAPIIWKQVDEDAGVSTGGQLAGMVNRWREAVASGEAERISQTRRSLIFFMQRSGILTELEATDPNLNIEEVLARARAKESGNAQ